MDLVAVLQVLRRQWIVVVGALLLTLATAVLLSQIDTATYASRGAVVIVRGPGAAGAAGVEGADPALQQTAQLLAEVAASSDAVRTSDIPGDVTATVDPDLPILRISAVAADGASATDTAQAMVDGLSTLLDDFRSSGEIAVADGTEIRQLVAPTEPEAGEADDGSLEFTSEATLLLARTGAADEEAGMSGIIMPSQDESFVAGVIFERLNDDAVRREMLDEGAGGEFELELDESNPLIRVEATSDDADEALLTGQVVVETMQGVAADIQEADGIPEDLRFGVEAVSYPLVPFVLDSATLRTVLVVLALGLLATIGLALMVDAAALRRELHLHPFGRPEGTVESPWDHDDPHDANLRETSRPTFPREP